MSAASTTCLFRLVTTARQRRARRLSLLAGSLCSCFLVIAGLLDPSATAARAKGKKEAAAWPAPKLHIPVSQIGYMQAGTLPAYSHETSLVTLDYIDPDHLLFTFNRRDLLQRLPHDPPGDEDRLIQANVIELSTGRSLAQTEWRLHDHGRYLWALGDGQFLLRERSSLKLLDVGLNSSADSATLGARPYLEAQGKLRSVYISPDKELAILQIEQERHTPEEHKRLASEALVSGQPPPGEDIDVRFLHLHPPRVFQYMKARTTIYLPATAKGVLETIDQLHGHWLLQSRGFDGKIEPVARLDSTCTPDVRFLNQETLLTTICQDGKTDRILRAFHLDGGELWHRAARSQDLVASTLTLSGRGERFGLSSLHTSRVLARGEALREQDILGQTIEVVDSSTGARLLYGPASPLYASGQNFTLSADGLHLAMLRDGCIDIFDLPPVQP